MLIAVLAVTLVAYPVAFGCWILGASLTISMVGFFGAGLLAILVLTVWTLWRARV